MKTNLFEVQASEKLLISKLLDYYNNSKPIGIYICYDFFGLLLLLMGTGLFFYPESFWRFQMMFTVRNGEPTDWAIFSNKIAGVLLVIMIYIGSLYVFLA